MLSDARRSRAAVQGGGLAASRYDRAKGLKVRYAAPRAWTHPSRTEVAVVTDDAPTRRRPLFEVETVYRNLVADGVME